MCFGKTLAYVFIVATVTCSHFTFRHLHIGVFSNLSRGASGQGGRMSHIVELVFDHYKTKGFENVQTAWQHLGLVASILELGQSLPPLASDVHITRTSFHSVSVVSPTSQNSDP